MTTNSFDLTQEHADAINALLPTCQYVVGIRHNDTGEVRFCPQQLPWDDSSLFWWSLGNFGCDCNRELEFQRQTDPDFDADTECGNVRFSLVGIWFPDGGELRDLQELNEC